jgi:hypothetical protein
MLCSRQDYGELDEGDSEAEEIKGDRIEHPTPSAEARKAA